MTHRSVVTDHFYFYMCIIQIESNEQKNCVATMHVLGVDGRDI